MNPMRTSLWRVGVVAGCVVLASGVILVNQHRHLSETRAEIDRLKALARSGQKVSGRGHLPRQDKAPIQQEPLSADAMSTAGAEALPEVRDLIGRLTSGWLGTEDLRGHPNELADDIDRLEELLSGMGAATARDLLDELSHAGASERVLKNLRWVYAAMNPSQSLAWDMTEDPGQSLAWDTADDPRQQREYAIPRDFKAWIHADRAAAVRWFQEQEAKGVSLSSVGRLLDDYMNAEANTDPVRAVAEIEKRMDQNPYLLRAEGRVVIGFSADAASGSRIGLINACNAAAMRPDASDLMVNIRDETVDNLAWAMAGEPFNDASAVADACFLPEQKLKLAEHVSDGISTGAKAWPHWAKWIASLDEPPEKKIHLLDQMVGQNARLPDRFGEPMWLDELPSGSLKDDVVTRYVEIRCQTQPEAAAKWLSRLSADKREEVTAGMVERLRQSIPPEAVEAFMKEAGGDDKGK